MNQAYRDDDSYRDSDGRILELYWARDEKAIRETDKKYGAYLQTLAMNILANRQDCEECLDDTWLAAWKSIPPARPHHLKAYLAQLTRRICLDKYRAKHAAKRVPSQLTVSLEELSDCLGDGQDEPSLIWGVQTDILAEVLNSYLRSLSKRERQMFLCRYYFADPVKRIADMFDVSESAVYKELARLRSGLRTRLEEEGYYV